MIVTYGLDAEWQSLLTVEAGWQSLLTVEAGWQSLLTVDAGWQSLLTVDAGWQSLLTAIEMLHCLIGGDHSLGPRNTPNLFAELFSQS